MSNFSSGYMLTDAGAKLMADVNAGKITLKLTKMQLGSGKVNTVDDYATRSALFAPQNTMVITSITTEDVGDVRTCLLTASLTSEAVEIGFEATELGIFARDSSDKEILYGVCYDTKPGYVPSKHDGNNVQINFAVRIITTSKATVELVLPQTATDLVALAQQDAAKAIEAAESAATSATNAETSNSYAQLAMGKASGYADDVAASAELARKSELAAKASEEAAKTSEANAKTSEDAAAASASATKTSQTSAATSETNARDSETNARNSASAAAESEENAANSENLAKKWAMSPVSPDGVVDTNSPTGYTQSAKSWAELSKEYAGLNKFKLPIGYYNSVEEMRKSETAIVGRPCVTLGFITKGDGRGAKYVVREPRDTDVYDDYSVVKLDNGKVAELIESSQAYEDDVKIIFPLYGDAEHPPVEETNGDCILVGRKNHWFMIDTYLCENNYVMIQRTMKAHNIKTLDFVLITHYHGDHYGNLERLLKDTAMSVKKVLLPRTTSQSDLASSVTSAQTTCIKWCTDNHVTYEIADNQVFDFYGVTVKIFNSSAEDYAYYENLNDKEYNDYSVCMLLSFMGRTALFTGDTQKAAKEKIVTDGIVSKPVDLFKMAHHANGPHVSQFARRLSPKYVVATQTQRMSSISAGWSSLSYYQSLGAYAHVVGWQSEDLVYSMSMLGVSMVSNGICAMDTRGWEAIDIFVDASVPRGTFCDGSKEHPYNDLQDAFDNCMHNGLKGANINIASGDYTKNEIAHSGIVRLQYANGISLKHEGEASEVLLPPMEIYCSRKIELHNVTIKTTMETPSSYPNLKMSRSECYVYSCVFTRPKETGVAVQITASSVLRIEKSTISNMYKALYASENSRIIVAGDMYGTGNRYTYSTQNGGTIFVTQNGFVEQVNRYYPYVDANPGIGQYIYSPVWATEPTVFTWRGTKIPNIGEDKSDIYLDYYLSISNTEKKYKKSYVNIIESSISEAPAYVGQIAVVNGVGYLATGTTNTSDWKQITK